MFLTVTLSLFEGLAVTIKLFALTLVFALPLGLIISFGSMSKLKVLRYPVKTLVWIVRGSPLMIQLHHRLLRAAHRLWYPAGCPVFQQRSLRSSSTTPAISPRSTVAASRASPRDSRRPVRCWA